MADLFINPISITMLKNFLPSFSKVVVVLSATLTLHASCTKEYDPGNSETDKSALLTGRPSSVNWVLNEIQIGNRSDTTARGARKVYHADGTFTDYLGFTGYWTLYSRDSLIESSRSTVNPSAPFITNHFHIDRLQKGSLQLSYRESDKLIRLVYGSNQ